MNKDQEKLAFSLFHQRHLEAKGLTGLAAVFNQNALTEAKALWDSEGKKAYESRLLELGSVANAIDQAVDHAYSLARAPTTAASSKSDESSFKP